MYVAKGTPFVMRHYMYCAWPDHGVPQHPASLIRFIKQVRKAYKNSQSPLIVHCKLAEPIYTYIVAITLMRK